MEKDAPYRILDDRDVFANNPDLLVNTPSRKDGIDEATETALRIYGWVSFEKNSLHKLSHKNTNPITGASSFKRQGYCFACTKQPWPRAK
jgi:hypothetical protein